MVTKNRTAICKTCKNKFEKLSVSHVFCTPNCRPESSRHGKLPERQFNCTWCSIVFTREDSLRPRNRFCTKKCFNAWLSNKQKANGNSNWKGDKVGWRGTHMRAHRWYDIGACLDCGKPAFDRHHQDGNILNNTPENIIPLCRRCHMIRDGRLARLHPPKTPSNSACIS